MILWAHHGKHHGPILRVDAPEQRHGKVLEIKGHIPLPLGNGPAVATSNADNGHTVHVP